MAADLLVENREFEVTEKARVVLEKNGIRIPLAYSEAINDPIYGSELKGAIHRVNSPDELRSWYRARPGPPWGS